METTINAALAEMLSILELHQLKHLAEAFGHALGPKQSSTGQDLLALYLLGSEERSWQVFVGHPLIWLKRVRGPSSVSGAGRGSKWTACLIALH